MLKMPRHTIRLLSGRDRNDALRADSLREGPLTAYGPPAAGVYLDTLALREAILAGDIVLQEHPGQGFVIHRVDGCRARHVGSFHEAAAAWEAIDEIDDALAAGHAEPEIAAIG
jgi:hypothetical protein